MGKAVIFLVVALWLLGPLGHDARAEVLKDSAPQFVQTLGDKAVRILSDEYGTSDEKRDKVREMLRDGFALPEIARFVLGRYWDTASPRQREEYQALFAEYFLKTYSQLLESQNVRKFAIKEADDEDGAEAVVHSRVGNSLGLSVSVSWRVQETNGEYRVIDLITEGVSLAKTFRSEIGSLVANRGMDALLQALRAYN